jgi:hypothetical protein
MSSIRHTWVLEREAFSDHDDRLAEAVRAAGHTVVLWDDQWWADSQWPKFPGSPVVFHGSLGNAARVRCELPWRPGAYCDTERFRCSSWYESARQRLVHRRWVFSTANAFAGNPSPVLEALGGEDRFFVRPASPLKPFAGRVLTAASLSMEALDYGFYYDDPSIPIVVTPVEDIDTEWRFVIVNGRPVAGCQYAAQTRTEETASCSEQTCDFALTVAQSLPAPEPVYVMDVCQCRSDLRLLELNPFSGAYLYGCDRSAVVLTVCDVTRCHDDLFGKPS